MFGDSPLNELKNVPIPVPSFVLLFNIVGIYELLQQTPLELTGEPPSLIILPPQIALIEVIDVTVFVEDITGTSNCVLNDTSLP